MVIVKLAGGLANQMFPYAMARRLAYRRNEELVLDVSGFEGYDSSDPVRFRKYALGVFRIIEHFASKELTTQILASKKNGIVKRLNNALFNARAAKIPRYYKERHFHFDPRVLKLKGNVYLKGNWNSERYFADIAEIIQEDFAIKSPQTGANKELARLISDVDSISIHVRRGDYACDPKTNQFHGTCGIDYYQRCMDAVSAQVSDPYFFVFSDDAEWARANLKSTYPLTVVDHNNLLDAHEDMRLMSQCKHNIIANSGFSWWGAWLNRNPQKRVYAPKRWFQTLKHKTHTLLPKDWVQL